MACEKKPVGSFTAKVGLVLLSGCILVPMSLVTTFGHYAVPMQTLSLLFSVGWASSVTPGGRSDAPVVCDFSSPRSDVCELKGDVRVLLSNATIVHFHPSAKPRSSWRMKPLARKHDPHALARVTEVTITSSPPHPRTNHSAPPPPPPCTATHAAPAVVFSAGGYAGNMFHVLTDVLVPLFATTRRLAGGDGDNDVHLLVRDAQPWWLDRYGPLLRGLSRHAVVDVDGLGGDAAVLCFPRVVVGLDFHKEMSVDAGRIAGGVYSMADFAGMVRRSYNLTRDTATRRNRSNTTANRPSRPRLLIISRKSTRTFTNIDAITSTATALGFVPVVAGGVRAGGELVRRDGGRARRRAGEPGVPAGGRGGGAGGAAGRAGRRRGGGLGFADVFRSRF
ncbi:hypothetical protein QOZ80_1BG0056260 [Eleusine coracana subsp. coracana]|nr:hypothetical protein QOZ80_1BG0056260 [Eleusine coracana subsp. coracana]